MNDSQVEVKLLTVSQVQVLEMLRTSESDPIKRRAGLLLAWAAGQSTREIASGLGVSHSTVYYWKRRFRLRGTDIFPNQLAEQMPILTPQAQDEETALPESGEKSRPADTNLPSVVSVTSTDAPSLSTREKPLAAERLPWPIPRDNPGILNTDVLAEAGRKVMLFHFAEMLRHESGTRLGEDPEALHDMRVATRRIRAAFEIFGPAFEPGTLKKHLKGLRATGRSLGRVRDLDVIIEKGRIYQSSLPEDQRAGFTPLLNFWATERVAAREAMLAFLNGVAYLRFIEKYNTFVQTYGAGINRAQAGSTSGIVQNVAPILIYTRMEAVRAFEPRLPMASIAELHALRIEFKKLRYTVEFFREVLGEQAKEVISELKSMQDHLGDLHDADVACLIVRDFLGQWDELQVSAPLMDRTGPESILAYLQARYAERTQLMLNFPSAWLHFSRDEFRQNLAMAIGGI